MKNETNAAIPADALEALTKLQTITRRLREAEESVAQAMSAMLAAKPKPHVAEEELERLHSRVSRAIGDTLTLQRYLSELVAAGQ